MHCSCLLDWHGVFGIESMMISVLLYSPKQCHMWHGSLAQILCICCMLVVSFHPTFIKESSSIFKETDSKIICDVSI